MRIDPPTDVKFERGSRPAAVSQRWHTASHVADALAVASRDADLQGIVQTAGLLRRRAGYHYRLIRERGGSQKQYQSNNYPTCFHDTSPNAATREPRRCWLLYSPLAHAAHHRCGELSVARAATAGLRCRRSGPVL